LVTRQGEGSCLIGQTMWSYIQYQLCDPRFYLQHSPFVACAALECLVAIWAATSGRHWFGRALAAVGAVMLLVPIRAWEPAWLFGLSSPAIIGLIRAGWWWNHRRVDAVSNAPSNARQLFRFGLRDLFLLVLIVGLSLPGIIEIARHYRPSNWAGWLLSSISLTTIALLSHACVAGPRSRLATLSLLVALPSIAAAVWAVGDWIRVWDLLKGWGMFAADMATFVIIELEFVGIMVAVLALVRTVLSPSWGPQWRLASGALLALLLTVTGGWLGWLYFQLLERPARVAKFAGAPNQYSRILVLAELNWNINRGNASIADLRQTVPTPGVALEMERLYGELLSLLAVSNAVDYDPDRDANKQYDRMTRSSYFRHLARSLQAEAEAARVAQQPDQAAEYGLAIVRLSAMLRRGGTGIDGLIGVGLEGVGHAELAKTRSDLSDHQRRIVIAALQQSLGEHEEAAAIFARDADFEERVYGQWQMRMDRILGTLTRSSIPGSVPYDEAANRNLTFNRLLQTDLAIRMYEREHGKLPGDLKVLEPEFLPAVLLDLYTEQPLRFHLTDGGYLLYSVGWDHKDDGGKFGNATDYYNAQRQAWPGLDFDVDTLTRP